MHNSRNRLSLLASIGALFSAAYSALPNSWEAPRWLQNLRGQMPRNPFKRRWSSNRFTPHQGAREMARRRGGRDWQMHRDGERAARGLPPMHAGA